jgi:hypothetical protein
VEEVLRKAEMDELDHATSNAEVEVEVEGEGEGEGPVVNETEAEAIAPAGVEVAPSSAKPAPQDDDEPEDGEVDDEANDDEDLVAAKAALVQRGRFFAFSFFVSEVQDLGRLTLRICCRLHSGARCQHARRPRSRAERHR